ETGVELHQFVRFGRRLDPLLEHLSEVAPLFERGVDAIEVDERVGVERLDTEYVAVHFLDLRDVAELLLERAREPTADDALYVRVLVEAEDVGVRVGELLPAAVDEAGQ